MQDMNQLGTLQADFHDSVEMELDDIPLLAVGFFAEEHELCTELDKHLADLEHQHERLKEE